MPLFTPQGDVIENGRVRPRTIEAPVGPSSNDPLSISNGERAHYEQFRRAMQQQQEELEKIDSLIEEQRAKIAADPNDDLAADQLFQALIQKRDANGALELIDERLTNKPEDLVWLTKKADLSSAIGKNEESKEALIKTFDILSKDTTQAENVPVQHLIQMMNQTHADDKDVIKSFNNLKREFRLQGEEIDKGKIEAIATEGLGQMANGNYGKANGMFMNYLAFDPGNTTVLRYTGLNQLLNKDFETALKTFDEGLEHDATDTQLLFGRAVTLGLMNKPEAIVNLRQVVDMLDPASDSFTKAKNILDKSDGVTDIRSLFDGVKIGIPGRLSFDNLESRLKDKTFDVSRNDPNSLRLLQFSDHHGDQEMLANIVQFCKDNKNDLDGILIAGDLVMGDNEIASEYRADLEDAWKIVKKTMIPISLQQFVKQQLGENEENKYFLAELISLLHKIFDDDEVQAARRVMNIYDKTFGDRYKKIKEELDKVDLPKFVVGGNHDNRMLDKVLSSETVNQRKRTIKSALGVTYTIAGKSYVDLSEPGYGYFETKFGEDGSPTFMRGDVFNEIGLQNLLFQDSKFKDKIENMQKEAVKLQEEKAAKEKPIIDDYYSKERILTNGQLEPVKQKALKKLERLKREYEPKMEQIQADMKKAQNEREKAVFEDLGGDSWYWQKANELMDDWSGSDIYQRAADPDVDIFITHGPAFGVGDVAGTHKIGSLGARKAIDENPNLLVYTYGHIHNDGSCDQVGNTVAVSSGNIGHYRDAGPKSISIIELNGAEKKVDSVTRLLPRLTSEALFESSEYRKIEFEPVARHEPGASTSDVTSLESIAIGREALDVINALSSSSTPEYGDDVNLI